jgi:hypothetical protein
VSFSLEVFAVVLPEDLSRAWIAGLASHGLTVQSHPQFDLRRWRNGWISFKCSAQVSGYPTRAFAAGFELDVEGSVEGVPLADDAPGDVRDLLGQSKALFHLSTPSARTVGDLRLQSFGAAVLADVCEGAVYDPQRDEFFKGAAAFVNAQREAESFESSAEPESWTFETFLGWSRGR